MFFATYSQASSIQYMGVRLESITLGHNPFKLGLTAASLHLPSLRPTFLCEELMSRKNEENNCNECT